MILAYSLMGMQVENELQSLLEGVDVPSLAALSYEQVRYGNVGYGGLLSRQPPP